MDLSVSLPRRAVKITGRITLEECLKSFIQQEKMDECGYKCSKCKAKDQHSKDMTIFRFPQVLVVHLKRFYNSFMRREKISSQVDIPFTLDMRPYAPHVNDKNKIGMHYNLYGISHHSGSLYGGHYIA